MARVRTSTANFLALQSFSKTLPKHPIINFKPPEIQNSSQMTRSTKHSDIIAPTANQWELSP